MGAEGQSSGARTEIAVLSLLVLVLAVEVVGWRAAHRTERELRESAAAESPAERVWSLHVLLNRGPAPSLSRSGLEELLSSNDALVREMAMTSDVWRLTGRRAQARHLKQVRDRNETIRSRYYLKSLGRPIGRSALRRYLRAAEAVTDATD